MIKVFNNIIKSIYICLVCIVHHWFMEWRMLKDS